MFCKSQALRTFLEPFWGVHSTGQTRDRVRDPLGKALTTQVEDAGLPRWERRGGRNEVGLVGRGTPEGVGVLGGRLGFLGWNTTAYVLLQCDLGPSTSTFCPWFSHQNNRWETSVHHSWCCRFVIA